MGEVRHRLVGYRSGNCCRPAVIVVPCGRRGPMTVRTVLAVRSAAETRPFP